tara:strand:- start:5117 stop:7300 length:2184 start_codon:yes stop_codon:yes gene_type:complete
VDSLVVTSVTRPNRLLDEKNREYHAQFARWALNACHDSYHQQFIRKTAINWNFYKGNQWIYDEDLESFLMDESGDVRNRIKVTQNLVRPIVEQYVGNAIRMNFNAKAVGVSEFVTNRREESLDKLRMVHMVMDESPNTAEYFQSKYPVGDDFEETKTLFANSFVDDYEKTLNNLMRYISEKNNFEEKKVQCAKHLAVSGMGILKSYERDMEQYWEVVDPTFFFFDKGAKRPDLKDSEFMGEYSFMLPTDIFEMFQELTPEEVEAIETYSNSQPSTAGVPHLSNILGIGSNRVPVYEVYWKDVEIQTYGYIEDEFGYEYFTVIGDDVSEEDLIIPKSEMGVKIMQGEKTRQLFVDVLRYAKFIPGEVIGTSNTEIVLEYGTVPYQEADAVSPSNVEFPYKVYCWNYNNGQIISPIDDVIDPQRFTNRVLSVAESHINNSRGSGTIIDRDTVDPQGGEEDVLRNMNLNKPVFINAKGNVNNSVGQYNSTMGGDVNQLFGVTEAMRGVIQNITGVNEAMTGTGGGYRELVGVREMQINQGSLMQEPFYFCLSRILLQAYQSMVTQGKRIYADNPRALSIATGDDGVKRIEITSDMKNEDFRVFIKRASSEQEQKQAANDLMLTLLQAQLIDQSVFAELFGKADTEDVARALRQHQAEVAKAQKEAEKARQEQMAQAQEQQAMMEQNAAQEMDRQQDRQDWMRVFEGDKQRKHEMDLMSKKEILKNRLGNK